MKKENNEKKCPNMKNKGRHCTHLLSSPHDIFNRFPAESSWVYFGLQHKIHQFLKVSGCALIEGQRSICARIDRIPTSDGTWTLVCTMSPSLALATEEFTGTGAFTLLTPPGLPAWPSSWPGLPAHLACRVSGPRLPSSRKRARSSL